MKTKTFKLNKLVRSKIVQKMHENEILVQTIEPTSKAELLGYFKEKLVEEANEVKDSKTEDEMIEEIADLQEVIESMMDVFAIKAEDIKQKQALKNAKNGDFRSCDIIYSVSFAPTSTILAKYYDYYLQNPYKYPEIEKVLSIN